MKDLLKRMTNSTFGILIQNHWQDLLLTFVCCIPAMIVISSVIFGYPVNIAAFDRFRAVAPVQQETHTLLEFLQKIDWRMAIGGTIVVLIAAAVVHSQR